MIRCNSPYSLRQFGPTSLWLMLAVTTAALAQESSSQRVSPQMKPVVLPSMESESMVGLRLDRDVYQNSTSRFADLRLLDDHDQEVPFVLQKLVTDKKRIQRIRSTVSHPKFRPLEDNNIEIEFDIDPSKYSKPVQGFTLITNLVNFEHQVTVQRQDSGSNLWNSLLSDAVIYDYSQFMDVKSTDIVLPKELATAAGGIFRIRINQATQEQQSRWYELTKSVMAGNETGREQRFLVNRQPFRIERIEFWHESEVIESSQPQLADYGLKVLAIEQDTKTKSTSVSLESQLEPLTEMTLVTDDNNFSRPFQLLALDSRAQLGGSLSQARVLASSNFLRIKLGNVQQEHLEISLPETREARYRVSISNHDSPALTSLSFTARGPIYEVFFLARPDRQYRLAYGNSLLESPEYDTAALRAALAANSTPLPATLGEQQAYLVTDTRPLSVQWLSNPWLVGGIIVALMVLLGGVLRQAAKRLDRIPQN